ncbi:MAG: RluA family pseudouridine synthase [Planctomycetota bacterium]|nr:MAG: RluA family pseudouridine synthase [Planctomycetota bacterium]
MEPLLLDNHLLAVAKPAGIPVQADRSGDRSLQEEGQVWLKQRFHKPGNVFLALVHRLDRPVSGVVLFARTSKAAARLSAAWREGRVGKRYLAVGRLLPGARLQVGETGELVQHLRKDPARNRVEVVPPATPGSRPARTRWRVLQRVGPVVLFELEPRTGRSHQLRVACAGLGAPLLGDLKYGASRPLPDRSIALHAASLVFPHPIGGAEIRVEAPLPQGFPERARFSA